MMLDYVNWTCFNNVMVIAIKAFLHYTRHTLNSYAIKEVVIDCV